MSWPVRIRGPARSRGVCGDGAAPALYPFCTLLSFHHLHPRSTAMEFDAQQHRAYAAPAAHGTARTRSPRATTAGRGKRRPSTSLACRAGSSSDVRAGAADHVRSIAVARVDAAGRWIARIVRSRHRLLRCRGLRRRLLVATAELGDDRIALRPRVERARRGGAGVRGDLDHAEALFEEALARGTSSADPRLRVDVMTNLGTMASIRGDFREALRCFQEALAHGRLHSLLDNIVVALNNLGLTNMALGSHDANADKAFTEAASPLPTRSATSRRACSSR